MRRSAVVATLVVLGSALTACPPSGRTQSASAAAASPSAKLQSAKPQKPRRQAYQPKSFVDVSNARPVNVAQLEEALRESRGRSDRQVARQLARLGLIQRFSLARLRQWQPQLPGKRSRRALDLLADSSSFLPLPHTDQAALPPPALADQKQMLSRSVDYLAKDLHQLPNFFATLVTEKYEESDTEAQSKPGSTTWRHLVTHRQTVLYREGREVVAAQPHNRHAPNDAAIMNVQGTFGPFLVTVIHDVAHGRVEWSHWEQGPRGPVAVFRYRIAKAWSHYDLSFETADSNQLRAVLRHQPTAYHGEFGVEPSTGAILRLTLEADPGPSVPIARSDIAIDYGPTLIGGREYICPVRSVAIARGWTVTLGLDGEIESYGTEISTLNQMTYTNYHVFRSNARILTGNPSRGKSQP